MCQGKRIMLLDILQRLSKLSETAFLNPWEIHGLNVYIKMNDARTFHYEVCRCPESFDEDDEIPKLPLYGVARFIHNKINKIEQVNVGNEQYDIENYKKSWKQHVFQNAILPVEYLNKQYHISRLPSDLIMKMLIDYYEKQINEKITFQYYFVHREMGLFVETIEV